jgi:hypothetical protein
MYLGSAIYFVNFNIYNHRTWRPLTQPEIRAVISLGKCVIAKLKQMEQHPRQLFPREIEEIRLNIACLMDGIENNKDTTELLKNLGMQLNKINKLKMTSRDFARLKEVQM